MEKIRPLPDHVALLQLKEGETVQFEGAEYTVIDRTTLASGEPALILARPDEQFVIGAAQFFASANNKFDSSNK